MKTRTMGSNLESIVNDLDGSLTRALIHSDEIPGQSTDCPHNGVYNAAMMQCHLCQIWYHYDCGNINEKEIENIVVWTCATCRSLPKMMSELITKVDILVDKVNKLSTDNTVLIKENCNLKSMISNIMEKCDKLTQPLNDCKNKETLVIGSSMVSLGLSLCIQLYYSLGHFLDEFQRSRFTSAVLYSKLHVWCNVPRSIFYS